MLSPGGTWLQRTLLRLVSFVELIAGYNLVTSTHLMTRISANRLRLQLFQCVVFDAVTRFIWGPTGMLLAVPLVAYFKAHGSTGYEISRSAIGLKNI